TDWMLRSLTLRPDSGGGVLFKAPKPDQDRRVDLPAIGPETVSATVAAGLSGIVIEKGGVIVLDRAAVVADCDALGLFLMVRERAS
ncbi:UDP-2,3-diacylglucosamine diphosphatase LpxI, partial [Cribrihabitans sp. XS_ASV171]